MEGSNSKTGSSVVSSNVVVLLVLLLLRLLLFCVDLLRFTLVVLRRRLKLLVSCCSVRPPLLLRLLLVEVRAATGEFVGIRSIVATVVAAVDALVVSVSPLLCLCDTFLRFLFGETYEDDDSSSSFSSFGCNMLFV